MYGKCQDKEKMARLYALYIARGELPEDARYVDRLRWMLSTVKLNDGNAELLQATLRQLMAKPRVKYSYDIDGPQPNNAYECLLREYGTQEAIDDYCGIIEKSTDEFTHA